jgi:hypothetical protein
MVDWAQVELPTDLVKPTELIDGSASRGDLTSVDSSMESARPKGGLRRLHD